MSAYARLSFGIGATAIILYFIVIGCARPADTHRVPVDRTTIKSTRFSITSAGTFRAGYDNNIREILLIKDVETGDTYLGITGVGIMELHHEKSGKVSTTKER